MSFIYIDAVFQSHYNNTTGIAQSGTTLLTRKQLNNKIVKDVALIFIEIERACELDQGIYEQTIVYLQLCRSAMRI